MDINANFRVKNTGYVYAREIEVTTNTFPDYVFSKNHEFNSIPELNHFILANKRLPGFENAEYYIKNGMKVSELILKQQEKLEEYALYIIELEKRIKTIEGQVKNLNSK